MKRSLASIMTITALWSRAVATSQSYNAVGVISRTEAMILLEREASR